MKIIVLPIILFLISCTGYAQAIQASYTGYWAETIWKFEFAKDSTYKRTSSGHYGNTVVSGKYKIVKDSLILISGYTNSHGTVNKYYLIDGDSCIIDMELKYDYCSNRPKKVNIDGEVWENFEGSRKRELPIFKPDKKTFTVSISIPQSSGIASARFVNYKITNDTLYVIDNGYSWDTAHVAVTKAKYPVSKELMQKLKETVAKTDSLGHHFNFCVPTVMGWPRFFIWFDDNGREADGFVANIYKKHIFDIVDVFNEIYPGGLIVYDKQELMKREKECDEEWKAKSKEEKVKIQKKSRQ